MRRGVTREGVFVPITIIRIPVSLASSCRMIVLSRSSPYVLYITIVVAAASNNDVKTINDVKIDDACPYNRVVAMSRYPSAFHSSFAFFFSYRASFRLSVDVCSPRIRGQCGTSLPSRICDKTQKALTLAHHQTTTSAPTRI